MPWFKVDDKFWSHPKTGDLSDSATALWLRAGSWSAGHLTDGFIPQNVLRLFRGRPRSAAELVAAGLWSAAEGGFFFHDWAEYQPSREQVTAQREATKKRVTAWKDRARNGVTDGVSNAYPPDEGNGVRNAPPDPTRPDPTRPITTSNEVVPRKRGSRVPPNFRIDDVMRAWAKKETPLVDIDAKLPEFIDYWTGVAGRQGLKTDWPATWRNGMRKQQEFAARDRPKGKVPVDWMNRS
jgi:hypothetical protein